jgi:ribose-phosphate pyrophosphokinase
MDSKKKFDDGFRRVVLLADHGSKDLAKEVYSFFDKNRFPDGIKKYDPDDLYLNVFNNGEVEVKIKTNIRGREVFVLKSTYVGKKRWDSKKGEKAPEISGLESDVNQSYMETFVINDALSRSSAKSITNIFPFMPYQRQDFKERARVPISASLFASLVTESGASRVVNFDPHSEQIQGFYHKAQFDALYADVLFAEYFHNKFKNLDGMAIFSTDAGGKKRANKLGEWLKLPVGIASKERPEPGEVSKTMVPSGYDIKGKEVIVIDDMADTCGSLVECVLGLKDMGAGKVYACVTHPILSCDAKDKLWKNGIELVTTNTIPIKDMDNYPNITVVSVAYFIAEAITSICSGASISGHLFDYTKYKDWKSKNGV